MRSNHSKHNIVSKMISTMKMPKLSKTELLNFSNNNNTMHGFEKYKYRSINNLRQ